MLDKYGTGQDPYCLPGTSVLNNRLGLTTDEELNEAERVFSTIAANEINFESPPYDLPYLCRIHRQLFGGKSTIGPVNSVLWTYPRGRPTSVTSCVSNPRRTSCLAP